MKKVFTNGVFDLFHEGHFNLLKKAKAEGDYLLVGVNSDESCIKYKRLPFQPWADRAARIRQISFVDEVIEVPFSDDVGEEFYQKNKIEIQIQGDKSANFFVSEQQGILKIVGRTPGISTSMLMEIINQKSSEALDHGYLNDVKKVFFEGQNYIIKYGNRTKAKKYPIELPDSRSKNEYEVIMSIRRLLDNPGFITKPICSDNKQLIIFECAPEGYQTLFEVFSSDLPPNEQALLSIINDLVKIHNVTYRSPELCERFACNDGYIKIKIALQCFAATQDPKLKSYIKEFMDESLKIKQVLLHGDFDPKNIMVSQDAHLFIDFEESGYGDPALDVGYFLAHAYMHKNRSKHIELWKGLLEKIFYSYLEAYKGFKQDPDLGTRIVKYMGLFLLSRIDGVLAPSNYILTHERPAVRATAINALFGLSAREILD